MIYTTAQLAIMVDTGISLSVALAGILEHKSISQAATRAGEPEGAVESGQDFSAALARYPKPSTRPTSPWSRPARPPARWAPCWSASPLLA